jgi:hypothetical protein
MRRMPENMSKTIIEAIEAQLAEVRKRTSALEAALAALTGVAGNAPQPKPGDRMADGTVYVGYSPTDGRPLYAMPNDLEGLHTWASAKTAAAAQTFAGRTDWRVPTKDELHMIYRAQEAIRGFKREACYWSSTEYHNTYAWHQHFGNGYRSYSYKNYFTNRVRCVRSG